MTRIAPATSFRPVHYLGSKLRLVDAIRAAVAEVARPRGAACDLFAGSGTVSLALADRWDVVAVDIQEYSRVLCSALLRPPPAHDDTGGRLLAAARRGARARALAWALEPLVAYETWCAEAAGRGDLEPLCELVEHGSLLAFARGALRDAAAHPALRDALAATTERLARRGLAGQPGSLVTRYFGGVYFSFAQAAALDALLEEAHALRDPRRDHYLAAVLSTASEIVNTVGKQFAQPIRPRDGRGRPKAHLVSKILRDRAEDVFAAFAGWLERYHALPRTRRAHEVRRLDYREFLASCARELAVVYADPPYTRDHYSRFYHVLETMCLRDNPEVSTMRLGGEVLLSRGVYRAIRHQSPFCIKRQAPGAFAALFAGVRRLEVPLVLSYSPYHADEGARPRLLTVEQIVALARQAFRRVELASAGRHAHHKLNRQQRNARVFYDAEVLVVCEP